MEIDLLTVGEVAAKLGCTPNALNHMRRAHLQKYKSPMIREINIGGEGRQKRIRFREVDIDRYLKTREEA